jgi:strongly similar to small multidrug resistance protein sugE
MAWLYLLIASVFEIGWPVGLKMAEISSLKLFWVAFAAMAMIFSGVFLYMAQKTIPIGTAYAIWTGVGASYTFVAGILFFHDTISFVRCLGIMFIITGGACLKYGH